MILMRNSDGGRLRERLFKIRLNVKLLIAFILLVLASPVICQNPENSLNKKKDGSINLLVLGDSILWGEGLKLENKPWYHVKVWLQEVTGRPVNERIEAHAGAVIQRASVTDTRTSTNAEVNLGLPTLRDQIDTVLKAFGDRSKIDLVLMSGCGNDVGLQNLLNASKIEEVDDMTRAKCGTPMESLLRRIASSFPTAQIIITGYYPFFSDHTRNDFVVKALGKRFFKVQPGFPTMSSKEMFARLKVNSKQWYETSNRTLSEAVRTVNSEIGHERISFAKIDFPSEYSFAAPSTHLWGFNRSPLRMALLLLSFGRKLLPTNDEVRRQRTASCNEVFRRQLNETTEEKREREALRLSCRYAALGHPNRRGAILYADAITNILKSSFVVTASSNR